MPPWPPSSTTSRADTAARSDSGRTTRPTWRAIRTPVPDALPRRRRRRLGARAGSPAMVTLRRASTWPRSPPALHAALARGAGVRVGLPGAAPVAAHGLGGPAAARRRARARSGTSRPAGARPSPPTSATRPASCCGARPGRCSPRSRSPRRDESERWVTLWRASAAWLLDEWRDEVWEQDMYGSRARYLGPGHGFAGNVHALLRGRELLQPRVADDVERRAVAVLATQAVHDGTCVQWPALEDEAVPSLKTRTQWCRRRARHGDRARRPARRTPEVDALLLGGCEPRGGPGPLRASSSLCHGTCRQRVRASARVRALRRRGLARARPRLRDARRRPDGARRAAPAAAARHPLHRRCGCRRSSSPRRIPGTRASRRTATAMRSRVQDREQPVDAPSARPLPARRPGPGTAATCGADAGRSGRPRRSAGTRPRGGGCRPGRPRAASAC